MKVLLGVRVLHPPKGWEEREEKVGAETKASLMARVLHPHAVRGAEVSWAWWGSFRLHPRVLCASLPQHATGSGMGAWWASRASIRRDLHSGTRVGARGGSRGRDEARHVVLGGKKPPKMRGPPQASLPLPETGGNHAARPQQRASGGPCMSLQLLERGLDPPQVSSASLQLYERDGYRNCQTQSARQRMTSRHATVSLQ